MSAPYVPPLLQQFVDDEMLRAPLLFDQVIEGALDHLRKNLPSLSPMQRSMTADLMQAMQGQRNRLSDHFLRSLREQVRDDLAWHQPRNHAEANKPMALALVDEDIVAMDVEISHTIEAIRSQCEHELRELQTFTSALVGDMDVSRDHNPFRAETYTRALAATAQALPMSRGHQVTLMRSAGVALAQLLRKSYAAATSRMESQGIEPAAYRTVILPSGARSAGRFGETTFSPDLHRMRDSMPAPLHQQPMARGAPVAHAGSPTAALLASKGAPMALLEDWSLVAGASASRVDRQAVELVSRLFESMLADERVPDDAGRVIARLHGSALRMTLRDGSLLDQDKHPLWRFINRLVFEVQMTPGAHDPERLMLLKVANGAAEQLASEPEQTANLYRWALDRLDSFLQKRFARRLSAASSHIGALQKLEDKLASGQDTPSTLHGMLDVPQLDTVPADLMDMAPPAPGSISDAEAWLDGLNPGDWVRLFLQGRWVHAALLWPGERREVWLFGDGASDATWAVRRGALLMMHGTRLAKKLKQRNIVGSAAARLQDQMSAASAA
jgi:hypothetical protein